MYIYICSQAASPEQEDWQLSTSSFQLSISSLSNFSLPASHFQLQTSSSHFQAGSWGWKLMLEVGA
jgi:hypothetical protein